MLNITFIVLFILIGFFMLFNSWMKIRKNGFSGAYSGFVFGMIIYYVVTPILVITFQKDLNNRYQSFSTFISSKSSEEIIFSLFLIFLSFVVTSFFYKIGYKQKEYNIINISNLKSGNKVVSIVAYATLILGGGSFLVLLSGLGGFKNALNIAELNRSFSTELSTFVDYKISLLSIPARLITVSPYLFVYLIFNRRLMRDKFFFSLSFILTIMFFLFNAGRTPIIVFLLCFLYALLKRKIQKAWTLIIAFGVISLPVLDFLDELFVFFNTGQWGLIKVDLISYLNQFIHPYRNILNVNELVQQFGFRFGSDAITSFINLIPGINYPVSYENTSFYYYGSIWTILGGIPNDVITFGYLQLGLIGLFIFCSVLGFAFGKIDKALNYFKNGPEKNIITAAIVLNCFFLVPSADLEPIIRSNFVLTILVLVILIVSKKAEKEKI